MNKANFFLGNSIIVLASLVIFISALIIPSNPNFESFTLNDPQLIEKFPSSVSQSEVHEADNKVGLSDFISALDSRNKITGMHHVFSTAVLDYGAECDASSHGSYIVPGKGGGTARYSYMEYSCMNINPLIGHPGELPDLISMGSGFPGQDPNIIGARTNGVHCFADWTTCGAAGHDVRGMADSHDHGDPNTAPDESHPGWFVISDAIVGPSNNAPVASADSASVNEDTTLSDTLTATDADGDSLTFSIVSQASNGVATITNANTGAFNYVPNSNYNGADSFTFKANDGTVDSNTATFSITVNSVNDFPVATNDAYSTNQDTPLVVADGSDDLMLQGTDDSDVDGDVLTVNTNPASGPSNGGVVINSNGAFTYTPNSGFSGTDSFAYIVEDGNGGSSIGTVTITVVSTNTAPTITTPSISPSSPTVSDSLTSSSSTSDADGDPVTKIYDWRVGGTSLASLNLPFDTQPSSSTINDYTSYDNDFTNNGATWRSSSTCGLSGSGGCLEFDGSNDRLTRSDDSDFDSLTALSVCAWIYPQIWGGTTNQDFIFDKRHNSNPWDSVAFFFHQSGDKLRLDLGATDGTNYALDFDHPSGDFPTGSWQFVCGTWDSTVTNMTIYYNGAKANSTGSTYGGTLLDGNGPAVIGVLGDQFQHWFDGYMDNIQFYNRALSANQISSMYNSGTPNYNIIHFDETTLGETWTVNVTPSDAIEDGNDGASSGVTVGSSNNAPVASADSASVNEDTTLSDTLTATDADGDSLTFSIVSQASNGVATITNANTGAFNYVPNSNYNGADSFTFKANDGTVDSNTATFSITVNSVNDPPTDISLSGSGILENQVSGTTVGTLSCTDPESDTCSFTELTGGNGHSQFDISGTSIVTTQVLNYESTSSYTFEVQANDGNGGTFDETITINVLDINETPSCTSDSYSNVNSGQSYSTVSATVNGVLANDDTGGEGSIAGGDFTATVNSAPSGASSFTLNTDGTFTYVSDATYTSATDSFTYTATDDDGSTCTGTATLTLAKTISIALSNSLSNAFTFSASAANAEVATTGSFHVNLTANGTSANLSISGSGDLSDGGSNSITLSNFKYNRTGNSNKVSLTTSETNLTESSAGNLFQTFFDFFIDVPVSQPAGSYTTTVTFRGETYL